MHAYRERARGTGFRFQMPNVSVFPNSKITTITRYGDSLSEDRSHDRGGVLRRLEKVLRILRA
jgi:predicted 3-demethylubiquinone-9 3-methyltransferase (glyoxalase superfamily)